MPLPSWITDRVQLETVSRQQAQSAYVGDDTVLCRVLGKYMAYADGGDVSLAPHLVLNGYWESWITVALARTVQPGWRCLDVGANHGYYTLVLAVEPNPRPAELLERTLELNGLHGIATVEHRVASDGASPVVDLVVPAHRGMNASLALDAAPGDDVVQVEATTLDTLTADWPWVDLVKIDVEGAEEAVWRGMHRLLQRNRDVIIVLEVNTPRYDDPAAFYGRIQAAGFPLRYIDHDAEVKPVDIARLTSERVGEDWMLYLARS